MGSDARQGATALTGVRMRRATVNDLPAVTALEQTCYSDPWPENAFTSLPANPRVYFSVAESSVANAITGYVVAWYVLDEGEIANLAVAPGYRGKGIGGALLDAAVLDATGRGASQLYLEVRESNRAARRLYASRGFEEVSRRKGYYRSPMEDALILRRTLKP